MNAYNYLYEEKPLGQLQLENNDAFCIEATSDAGLAYYLIAKTICGETEIIEYGPVTIDFEELPCSVLYAYNRIDYNSNRLDKIIENFLNSPKKVITQAREVTLSYAKSKIKNLVDVIKDDSEGND